MVMNFVSAITTYTDLFYQVHCLWNHALNENSPKALSEINRMLDRIFDKIVIEQGTGKFYRARIVSPRDYDKIQLKDRMILGSKAIPHRTKVCNIIPKMVQYAYE